MFYSPKTVPRQNRFYSGLSQNTLKMKEKKFRLCGYKRFVGTSKIQAMVVKIHSVGNFFLVSCLW